MVAALGATTACLPPVVGGVSAPTTTAPAPATWTLDGHGWGHGVGMSQYGARNMAAAGAGAAAILGKYYPGAAVTTVAEASNIRAQVAPAAPSFTVTAGQAVVVYRDAGVPVGMSGPGSQLIVTRSGNSVTVSGAVVGSGTTLRIDFVGPVKVTPPGHRYEYGRLVVVTDGTANLAVRNEGLTMAQLLYGLGEMPSSWPTEALKAQAVAARTFAQKRQASGGVLRSWMDISYIGRDKVDAGMFSRWKAAVDASAGQVITYRGGLVDALFSSSNGGRTASSASVWGGVSAYLVEQADTADPVNNPWANWRRTYSSDQLGAWVGVGTLRQVGITGATGVRLDKATMTFVGTTGTRTMTGGQFRSTVNARGGSVPSTWFTIAGR